MKNMKKGISLIILVIAIIVVIILAGVVILSLQKSNLINQASKAKFINDVSTFKEDLELYKHNQYLKSNGKFNPETLNAPVDELDIYDVIPSLKDSSYGKNDFKVEKGKLVYQGTNKDYQDWSKDAGIEVDKGQVMIKISAMQMKPVKAGVDIKYSIELDSASNITDNNLDKNIVVIDKDGKDISTQPEITLSEYSGTDTSKTTVATINTIGMSDGEYKLKIKAGAINNNVNVANDETISSESFEIDNTAPNEAITYTISPEGYTNGNVTLTLNKPLDADKMMYSTDGTNYTQYSAPLTVTSDGNIYAKSIDIAGNESTSQTIAITSIDRTNPDISIDASVSGQTINGKITLSDNGQIDYTKSKYTISDKSVSYNASESIWDNAIAITESITNISQTEGAGDYYIQVLAVDKAGNNVVLISIKLTISNNDNMIDTGYNNVQGVNGPVLAKGMTPIKWNGTTLATTTTDDTNWYNYTTTNKQWANTQTADGSMWVWIPRYEYKIVSLYHQSSTSSGEIDIKFIKTSQITADNGYIIEPAFTFGDAQLSGIWVAKFEATAREGVGNSTSVDNVTTKHVKVMPGVQSWRYSYISTMFDVCRNMEKDSTYGWTTDGTDAKNIDTHLMKNVEWGACAYLSQSVYGKNSEVTINSNSSYCTGGGTGNAYITNIPESTTGNVYGIYDMSGGAYEYTAAYVNTRSGYLTIYGSSLVSADEKYKDVYSSNGDTQSENYSAASNKVGDAVYETSSSGNNGAYSWYSDGSYMPCSSYPFFIRGGYYYAGASAGLFYFDDADGNGHIGHGFRPTVAVCDVL